MSFEHEPQSPIKSPESESKTWGMILHLSVFAGYVVPLAGLIAPIVIWQIKKDEFPILDAHGKNLMNFLITILIASVVAGLLTATVILAIIGIPLLIALGIAGIVMPIIAAIKANDGIVWPYPYTLKIFS